MKTTTRQGKGFLTGNFVKPVVQKIASNAILLVNRGTKAVKASEIPAGRKISIGLADKRSGKGYLN
tara:strand:- start:348 stop:545 length:198 start_codon:yes stop_codon:yes gene_type:complete